MPDSSDDERLRQSPGERFANPERLINLDQAFQELLDEPHEAIEGHRQISLAKREGFSLLLFAFEEGATMPDHEVDGEVTIHVLEGELHIDTDEHHHEIEAGEVLILSPQVTHDVDAQAESRMLLTVQLSDHTHESTE